MWSGQLSRRRADGHELSMAVSEHPELAWISGDAANAYNSVDRVFAFEEAVRTSALLAESAAAMYGEPTRYVQRRKGQEARV